MKVYYHNISLKSNNLYYFYTSNTKHYNTLAEWNTMKKLKSVETFT